MFFEWHPTVVHDLHESVALLMSWNGTGPYNPNIDPITFTEFQALSFHEVQTLTSFGMPGAATWHFGEAFAHLYLDSVAMNHNSIGRGYETFGNGTAETLEWTLTPEETSREWYRVQPRAGRRRFSGRHATTSTTTRQQRSRRSTWRQRNRRLLLRSFYRKGFNSWRKGVDEPPYAFAIAADQGDPTRVAQLIARLQSQHIEVHRSNAAFTVKEGAFGVGTYLVRLDQPYRNYAVDLLAPQEFPKNGGEPYDDVSWELPAHYHVEAVAIADPAIKNVGADRRSPKRRSRAGKLRATGRCTCSRTAGRKDCSKRAIGWRNSRSRSRSMRSKSATRSIRRARGSCRRNRDSARPCRTWLARVALDFDSIASTPDVARHAAKAPRLGVWVPWADTDSIGWLRHTLDERNIPYAYVRDEDIRAGNLRAKYDVLLYGHVDLELAEQIHGLPKAWGPMPFKKTKQTPSHGTPASSKDITGGIGWDGLAQIQKFVEGGGVMVTLGSGSMLALEGGIVRGVRRDSGGMPRSAGSGGAESAQAAVESVTRTPGSHVRVSFAQPDHPIAYGYPAHTHVFRQNYPLYAVPRRWLRMAFCTTCLDGPSDPGGVVMQWGDTGTDQPFLVSGQVWGESNLIGRPAILDMPVGRGHVVAFNFNPAASRLEPRRSAPAVERHPELGSDPRAALTRGFAMIRP